ncbi:transferrin receptor 1a [Chanos chanos]|uniref:Transferrin receptor protein 1 n=1 Tax=Chanos chanos TaxID=29144 RepID=A0A6J2VC49_CHACN|nr:transferrin receptor protein 1-like [Chanos chanos]
MDQARSTISKIFNGEPRSYTRFSLTQNMEGENSQVEMKLSSDMDEEVGGNGVGEHLNHTRPSNASTLSQRNPRKICFIFITALLVFTIGYLIGYASHQKTDVSPSCTDAESKLIVDYDSDGVSEMIEPVAPLTWEDLTSLLSNKLSATNIEDTLSEFSSSSHKAGSSGDEDLAYRVMKRFEANDMEPWTDQHFVKVQEPPLSGNSVTFRGRSVGRTLGYLAYSAPGTVEGTALYAHYGLKDDLTQLQQHFNIDFAGKVLLVRAGRISFAEKVANAASVNASAVLIYLDPADYKVSPDADLYGHVHLGSGDPYTPSFPSFNHTQFPPIQSSGLPTIPAQTITASMAASIMRDMKGELPPRGWADGELNGVEYRIGNNDDEITVEVKNVLVESKIHNVFGVIKGFTDSDRYLVIGAQRDAWGPGFAKSTVGTTLLVELASAITKMIKDDGFKPRRSIIFASWSAGEYGSVGATEWLEGYLSSLSVKAFSYISLDGVVRGSSSFRATASPLMYNLIENTLKEVSSLGSQDTTLFAEIQSSEWTKAVMRPMMISDPAYPFLTLSGIPSISFWFGEGEKEYPYFGTQYDTKEKLGEIMSYNIGKVSKTAAQIAGQMALRLVHDHVLRLNVEMYTTVIRKHVFQLTRKINSLKTSGRLPKTLTGDWLISALGSYSRASRNLLNTIQGSDLEDAEQCRVINDRIMRVERDLLSPYVSPRDSPFRHILVGSGPHTLSALQDHLEAIKQDSITADVNRFQVDLALATWTIQGCANAIAGPVWALNNDI